MITTTAKSVLGLASCLLVIGGGSTLSNINEAVDQSAHFLAGFAIACDLVKHGATEGQATDFVDDFAVKREKLQHAVCKEGCQRDLRFWRRGATSGAEECS